jgi:glycerophosphoryl diester phosphodiesterase
VHKLRMSNELGETRPLLLGHRGVRFNKSVHENTMAAFDFALDQGCDGFEFDVRLTADDQAVVCHDEVVKPQGLKIAECPAYELGLPTLEEVLNRYKDRAFLDVELKVPGLEEMTVALLKQWLPARGFVVSSFLPEVLQTLHNLNAALPLGLICETHEQLSRWTKLPAEYVIPHCDLLGEELISALKAKRRKMIVWTVNLPVEMKRYAGWGVDGIVSDYPEKLASTLAGT